MLPGCVYARANPSYCATAASSAARQKVGPKGQDASATPSPASSTGCSGDVLEPQASDIELLERSIAEMSFEQRILEA
jgi:hypothetical protein